MDGWISGIRYFKGAGNTGTHVGRLWTLGGTKLAEATFTDETATGWQTVRFATAVEIDAGTTYVASYHAPNGHYAVDRPYFASAHLAPPLRALADGASGANGVFLYGAGGFPSTSPTDSPNYYVDVVFETQEPADMTPPVLTGLEARDVSRSGATIAWTTDEPATSRVEYGTSPGSLTSIASAPGLAAAHAVALSGLSEGTTYWFRAVSEDAAENGRASDIGAFTATDTSWTETSDGDLSDGTRDGTQVGGGAVTLASEDFVDPFDQADGAAVHWEPGEASDAATNPAWNVANGVYTHELNATPDSANYHPSFLAAPLTPTGDFTISARQRIVQAGNGPGDVGVLGFVLGSPDPSRYFIVQYAAPVGGTKLGLKLKQKGPGLMYPTLAENMSIADPEVGRWYDLRVDVAGSTARVYVDGVLQLTHTMAGYTPARIGLLGYEGSRNEYDDVVLGNGRFALAGTYTSNVFDAGTAADWGLPSWTAAVPSGTTLALSARWGHTPSPDSSWTAFAPLPNDAPLGVRARYMQWRAELASSGAGASTPRLESLTLPYMVVRNADPVARDDDFALDEDSELQGDVLANDSDADGDTLTVSPGTAPEHGTLTLEADGSFEYAPAADFHGNDHFTYTVADGQGGTASAEVAIEVRPVNDQPVARDDAATVEEDASVIVDVLANDSDADADSLTVSEAGAPEHGSVEVTLGWHALLAEPELPWQRPLHLHRLRRPGRNGLGGGHDRGPWCKRSTGCPR